MIMMLRCLKKKIMLVMMPMRKTVVVVTVADHWQLLMVLMTLQDAMEAGVLLRRGPEILDLVDGGGCSLFLMSPRQQAPSALSQM